MTTSFQEKYIKTRDAWNNAFKDYRLDFSKLFLSGIAAATKEILIDVLKFDEIIHQIHGSYPGKSLNDIILEKYGKEAFEIFCEVTQW